jgi:hypothetical protein
MQYVAGEACKRVNVGEWTVEMIQPKQRPPTQQQSSQFRHKIFAKDLERFRRLSSTYTGNPARAAHLYASKYSRKDNSHIVWLTSTAIDPRTRPCGLHLQRKGRLGCACYQMSQKAGDRAVRHEKSSVGNHVAVEVLSRHSHLLSIRQLLTGADVQLTIT